MPGYVYEEVELDEDRTAFIVMHCWNIGCADGPKLDPNFWVGMGFPETFAEAERIMRQVILPSLRAARDADVFVCHVEAKAICDRRRGAGPGQAEGKGQTDPKLGWRRRIAERSHGKDYESRSPLAELDRCSILEPLNGEPLVCQTQELQKVLEERKIENLIYTGFATDMCILRAPGGIEEMAPLDYRLFLMRDATLGVECPDTFAERLATRWAIRYFETHFGDTVTSRDFIKACRLV